MARDAILVLVLALAMFAVVGRVGVHEFPNLDVPRYISSNPYVQDGLSPQRIRCAFRAFEAESWHPLTWLSIMLDCELFGRDAGRHHLMAVGYHAVSSVLLFVLLRQMTGAAWRSFAVLREKIPLLLCGLGAGIVTLQAQSESVLRLMTGEQRITRLANASWSVLANIGDLFWPVKVIGSS